MHSHSRLDRVGRTGSLTADGGSPTPIATGHSLLRTSVGGRPVTPVFATAVRDKVDLVRTDSENLTQFAQLGHLGRAAPALPRVDRLRLDAHFERQLELGPPVYPPQRPDRLHARHPPNSS